MNEYMICNVCTLGLIFFDCGQPRCPHHTAPKTTGAADWTLSAGCAGSSVVAGTVCHVREVKRHFTLVPNGEARAA